MISYKNFIIDFVKIQKTILGDNLAIDAANMVDGLELSFANGSLVNINGDPLFVAKSLVRQFRKLSEPVTAYIISLLANDYPDIVKDLDISMQSKFSCPLNHNK